MVDFVDGPDGRSIVYVDVVATPNQAIDSFPTPVSSPDKTKLGLRSRLPIDLPRRSLGRQHRIESLIDRFDGSLVVIGPEMRVRV